MVAPTARRAVVQADYSARLTDNTAPRPHDLVWFTPVAVPADCPDWAATRLAAGGPAVIRRAPRGEQGVPIGLRGRDRSERYASWLDAACVVERRSPESLAARVLDPRTAERARSIPAWQALIALAPALDSLDVCWGITGGLGFELATGEKTAHAASDLDLLVRMPERADAALAALAEQTACASSRCDIQLETPAGGVALGEWQRGAGPVLVKSDTGPWLTADPWAGAT